MSADQTWKATIDKHAAEADLTLAKLGPKLTLTVSKESITFKGAGCCSSVYVLPLTQVKECKCVAADWALPSLVIVAEKLVDEEPVKFFHKLWVDGNQGAIEDCCNKIDAQIRLLYGQVLVAGYIDPSVPNLITWFSAADTTKIFEMESAMITSGVSDQKTLAVPEMDGVITFTRLTYGLEMLFTKEGLEVPCSVFCERVHTIQFQLPVVEEEVTLPNGEVVKAFRLQKSDKEAAGKGSWTVTLDPKVVLSAPYLAGLSKSGGSSRPRVTSFSLPRGPRFPGTKKTKTPAAKPSADAPAEEAAPKAEPKPGFFGTIKRKASLTFGQKVDPPAPAEPAESTTA